MFRQEPPLCDLVTGVEDQQSKGHTDPALKGELTPRCPGVGTNSPVTFSENNGSFGFNVYSLVFPFIIVYILSFQSLTNNGEVKQYSMLGRVLKAEGPGLEVQMSNPTPSLFPLYLCPLEQTTQSLERTLEYVN